MEEELRTSTIGSNNDNNYYEIIVSFLLGLMTLEEMKMKRELLIQERKKKLAATLAEQNKQ